MLIPEAEKFASCLERLIKTHSNSYFTLTLMNPLYCKILTEMFADNDMVEVLQTSIYKYEFTSKKFDWIPAVPIFGARELPDGEHGFICREYDMIAVENLALHLASGGVLSIVLPARITFGGSTAR